MNYTNNYNPTISDEEVFESINQEREHIGYYNLVHQDTTLFKEYVKTVKQKDIVVIGIGGSTLGTYAIYKFLKYSKKLSKKLHFLESTDPIELLSKIDHIDLNDALFIVISKSGTTVETISIWKYINSLVKCDASNTVIVTEDDSKLHTYAIANNMKTFDIPKNVGGRFSVFSAVGLLPLAIVGLDIDELLKGAKEVNESFFSKSKFYERILKKARFFAEYKNSFNINVVFSYSSRLEGFNKWYIQLWGESLGKIDINSTKQGLTPVGIIGPIDQHSFLQLIMEGRRDKTVTVVKVEDFHNEAQIPGVRLKGLEELSYLENLNFSYLINEQADATIQALNDLNDIPCDVISLDGVDESCIASLMYEYELLTSVVAKFLYINAYDQPGVEAGKIILKTKLKKD
ncbi:glucose-6-phosphate isomerase [Sulfurimonas sp.]|uniref:glucose-6-phosphate isomerase n=1 Tax=Sulfurimonas sp. TaxID=2022749 RepID=UPI003566F531